MAARRTQQRHRGRELGALTAGAYRRAPGHRPCGPRGWGGRFHYSHSHSVDVFLSFHAEKNPVSPLWELPQASRHTNAMAKVEIKSKEAKAKAAMSGGRAKRKVRPQPSAERPASAPAPPLARRVGRR